MKVRLINYTRDGERLIASAAKLCYSPVGVDNIEEDLDQESVESFLNMLMKLGHMSPIEHVSFTFAVEGVSRSLSHQLVRHRVGSYSQQSQRYVKLDQFEYVTPPSIEGNKALESQYKKAMEEIQKNYDDLTAGIIYDSYRKNHSETIKKVLDLDPDYWQLGREKELDSLLGELDSKDLLVLLEGLEKHDTKNYRSLEKKAIEDARYILPNACETKLVFTMNARSLLNFFSLRSCNRAQWEIRDLAEKMIGEVGAIYPTLFQNAGPACINGPCPEGPMTCGKINEVREKYKK